MPVMTVDAQMWISWVRIWLRYMYNIIARWLVHITANRENFVLKIFLGVNVNYRRGRLLRHTITLGIRMRLIFACLVFVAKTDYENILTTKFSRFTVLGYVLLHVAIIAAVSM